MIYLNSDHGTQMPKLNRNLIRSIVQDVKEISSMCTVMSTWVGRTQCMSWRYPTKECSSVVIESILAENTQSASEKYILLLELIYDRIHYVFDLLVKFMDMLPVLAVTYSMPRNVICPNHLSLGALLNMYWQRNTHLYRYLLNKLKKGDEIPDSNSSWTTTTEHVSTAKSVSHISSCRGTQTDVCLLEVCESCLISEKLVENLANDIEAMCCTNNLPSAISDTKLNVKKIIFHVSQWGAMQTWTQVITKDVATLLQVVSDLETLNFKINTKLKSCESKAERKIQLQKDKITTLESELNDLMIKYKSVKSDNDEAMEKEAIAKKEVACLNKMVTAFETTLSNKDAENKSLEHQLQTIDEQLEGIFSDLNINFCCAADVISKLATWKTAYCDLRNEKEHVHNKLQETENMLEKMKQDLKNELEVKEQAIEKANEEAASMKSLIPKVKLLTSQLEDYQTKSQQLEVNLDDAYKMINFLNANVSKLEIKLNECKSKEKLLMQYPDLTMPPDPEVYGDPQQDMESQIKSNNIRIKLLQEQNMKLQSTVTKLKKFTTK